MVHVPKQTKIKIYKQLLNDGVFVLKKDFQGNHEETNVPNLHCYILLRSLKDRGLMEEVYNWGFTYLYLNLKGCEYLKEKLGISADNVIPNTFKASKQNYISREEDDEEGKARRRMGGAGPRGGNRGEGGRRGYGQGGRRRNDEEQVQEQQNEQQQEQQQTAQ
ncbi:hypothetical protein IMG5_108110 [Ichthyophthirius multifiliis]|uniref:Plectin/eS10 N-terminal domain-containing protein n=1 Tax=Ichthyophthirius multifiliis TaxID=5932 RepID=G0QTF8_ICHMU|nr:hypothetical protein IMG5_108110 [Ichthyophthirius multifiliis]EGR31492.1 hypothetical protein IMG5_108110 [Ichthyophthirius multifiliis]|eukprot:XP_004034978.1 hypothetical protein IMG5_108110 [Ichthyophthirius multifiliis]